MRFSVFLVGAVMLGTVLSGCERVSSVRDAFREMTPHEQYAQALQDGDLASTALAQDWLAAADRALDEPLSIALPFREVGYFDPAEPSAVGYAFDARRGQELRVDVEAASADSGRLFVDLFRVPSDTTDVPRPVASTDTAGTLTTTMSRDGRYLLRLQPELLRGGRYTLTLEAGASLAVFPVAGTDSRDIRSWFGDPRDAGAREHHGVDIFAPRGTPVLAVTEGRVGRTGDGGRGGKTIWLRGENGGSFYYAHLDTHLVRMGTDVSPGDTIGRVGNTGNARTTPPHLHFGFYQRGPVDPYPFVHEPRDEPPQVTADTSRFGRWSRVAVARANLRRGPTTDAPVHQSLGRHTALRLVGSTGAWHRVRLPDGTDGFVAASLLGSADTALRTASFARTPVRHHPARTAAITDSLRNEDVGVHGRFRAFILVDRGNGRTGWVRDPEG